ncbi:hypothetical protein [Vibrio lentus]|uniref:hypothetical protein n=1 Tax=Vibrio lentus TaxID=136468 RepID=UPI000976666B|nr:hypothetical protein [Vibrio lentus]OMO22109.1 hypothetical protein BH583_07945 [Vibrio lentus]PMN15401.1 hypothetical protein BCT38_01725 [Vibrio lentus]
MSDFKSALIGGVVASIFGIAGQYFVGYELVEKPKLVLDQKKTYIEAHKIAQDMLPMVITSCEVSIKSNFSFYVTCTSDNQGEYPVFVEIEDSSIILANDDLHERFTASSFSLSQRFPDDKKTFKLYPGTNGYLDFYLELDSEIFSGAKINDWGTVITSLKYSSDVEYTKSFIEVFPEFSRTLIKSMVMYEDFHSYVNHSE